MSNSLNELFVRLSRMCAKAPRPVVLIIDEVDSASNNQVFLDFLAQMRGYYLARRKKPIFHSVILAGVYDIKNLKLKLRSETEHKYNSPWNISADFDMDMSFAPAQIAFMLQEYASENHVKMDAQEVAEEIYQYTSGYPYLVSAICKLIDEKLLNTFIAKEALRSESYRYSQSNMNQFIIGGRLDMTRVLEKFVVHFHDIYGRKDDKFIEDYGRKFFLLYLKPIINGTGNYYIEAQTRDARRTDVIVEAVI